MENPLKKPHNKISKHKALHNGTWDCLNFKFPLLQSAMMMMEKSGERIKSPSNEYNELQAFLLHQKFFFHLFFMQSSSDFIMIFLPILQSSTDTWK